MRPSRSTEIPRSQIQHRRRRHQPSERCLSEPVIPRHIISDQSSKFTSVDNGRRQGISCPGQRTTDNDLQSPIPILFRADQGPVERSLARSGMGERGKRPDYALADRKTSTARFTRPNEEDQTSQDHRRAIPPRSRGRREARRECDQEYVVNVSTRGPFSRPKLGSHPHPKDASRLLSVRKTGLSGLRYYAERYPFASSRRIQQHNRQRIQNDYRGLNGTTSSAGTRR